MAIEDGGPQAARSDGSTATRPSEIPARGWRAVLTRVVANMKRDHLPLLAAGVAFKALLAIFPAIVAAISTWALVADPSTATQQLQRLTDALPAEAADLVDGLLQQVVSSESSTLGTALVVSLALALWSASSGTAGLVEGINGAYEEVDRRSFLVKRGLALLLTLGAIVALLVTLGLIAVLPALLGTIGLGSAGELAVRIGTWPVLALLAMAGLALLYRLAPHRDQPRLRWTSWGAAIATLLWLLGSAGFAFYVDNVGDLGATYGAFAGIIILMLWLQLTSFIVLLGAAINGETERQTRHDTTVGDPEPIGERGARSADTTPEDWQAEIDAQRRRDSTVDAEEAPPR